MMNSNLQPQMLAWVFILLGILVSKGILVSSSGLYGAREGLVWLGIFSTSMPLLDVDWKYTKGETNTIKKKYITLKLAISDTLISWGVIGFMLGSFEFFTNDTLNFVLLIASPFSLMIGIYTRRKELKKFKETVE
jgi:hypothetical protein